MTPTIRRGIHVTTANVTSRDLTSDADAYRWRPTYRWTPTPVSTTTASRDSTLRTRTTSYDTSWNLRLANVTTAWSTPDAR